MPFLLVSIFLSLSGVFAQPADEVEAIFESPQAKQNFIAQVIQENPWVVPMGVGAFLPSGLEQSQKFLEGLRKHPQYEKLIPLRRPLIKLHIEQAEMITRRLSVLPRLALERIQQEIIHTIEELEISHGKTLGEALEEKLTANLRTLSQSDPKGILTGMIHCLNKEHRGALFKIAALPELLEVLSKRIDLTDDALRAHFQGEAHQIRTDQISREFLIYRVKELLAIETKTIEILRAKWFLENISSEANIRLTQDRSLLGQVVVESPSVALDVAEANEKKWDNFVKHLQDRSRYSSTEAHRRVKNYLERVTTAWKEAEHVFEERKVQEGRPYLILLEVPPYLAVHRSRISGDCGTQDDFPYPYSPVERSFFVFKTNGNGVAIGYIGTTLIDTENELTLFVHDATGRMDQLERNAVLEALYRSLNQLGTQKMTVGIRDVVVQNRGGSVQNTYIDKEIRQYFNLFAVNPHGDRPEDNLTSTLFVPQEDIAKNYIFRVEQGTVSQKEEKPISRQEAFIRLLEGSAGTQGDHSFLDYLGIERQERERILRIIRNTDRFTLAEYYQRLQTLFEEFDANLSENFIKKHEAVFIQGHLSSRDLFTSADEGLQGRTIEYVLAILKRGKDRNVAYDLIRQNSAFFSRFEKFVTYVGSISLEMPEGLTRVKLLLQAGIDPVVMATTSERLEEMIRAKDISLQLWAVREWHRRYGRDLPLEMIEILGKALKNEKHETDEISLSAVRFLKRVHRLPQTAIESLKKSVSREENTEIGYLAALALLRNGVSKEAVEALVKKNKDSPELQKRMAALFERFNRRFTCKDLLKTIAP